MKQAIRDGSHWGHIKRRAVNLVVFFLVMPALALFLFLPLAEAIEDEWQPPATTNTTNEGTLKWKFKTKYRSPVESSPAIGSDGTVYVGSYDGYLYAIKPDGTLKWKFNNGGGPGALHL